MNYSPWLNDDITDRVQDVWNPGSQIWVNLKLPLTQHSIITRLSFYDMEGIWADKPDTIYALNGTVLTMIGTFTGPNYQTWDDIKLAKPVEADALFIRKFGNNIPAKIKIYGYPDISTDKNADLKALTLSNGTLTPVFDELTQGYTAKVSNDITSITVKPTVVIAGATIQVNGKAVASGSSSASLPLVVGTNKITISVTSKDKSVVRPYVVTVSRHPSTDDKLSKLTLSNGTLSPIFSETVNTYTATVANSVTFIRLTPTVDDLTSVVEVNGVITPSGKASAIVELVPGVNNVKVVVTAQDKITTETYTVKVTRTPLTIAGLSGIILSDTKVSPVFNTSVYNYAAQAATSATSITVAATSLSGGTIKINGKAVASGTPSAAIPIVVGANTIKIVVTAQDGITTNTYFVVVNQKASENAYLFKLGVSKGKRTPAFKQSIYAYEVLVSNQANTINVTPIVSDTTSTVKVGGVLTPNAFPVTVQLKDDTTFINTVVTTADGTMSKAYTMNIIKTTTKDTTSTPDSTGTPPDTTAAPPDTTHGVVKIPIDPSRWYIMNNVSNGLAGLFDGVVNTYINVGYGLLFNTFDCYYPVRQGEAIDLTAIKFYSYTGGIQTPMLVSVIDSTGTRTQIASYSGGLLFNQWVGPYPGKTGFNLTKTVKNVKYIVLTATTTFGFPTEMELDGYYTAPPDTTPVVRKGYPLGQYFGVNAFEWNFEDPNNPGVVSTTMLTAMKSFTQFRHYMDWQKLESEQGEYTYNPVHSGGWNYDALYKAAQTNNMVVLADLKTQPSWMEATWPADQQDSENVPVLYGKDYNDPNSYLEQAKVAFQYAARYGTNVNVLSSLLSVDPSIRWANDVPNTVKKGLNLITYFECDNERDKWWKGAKAYQNCYQYAANMSAFYDGNKNTMGAGVGVKNADPNMQVVIGGLCSADPTYIHGMVEWCKQHRGYKADGTVNLCWDIINYHFYANNGVSGGAATIGQAPELGITAQLAQGYMKMAHQYTYDQPVWVTESGYDLNPNSPQRAPAIGSKSALLVQGDWILRTALLYARTGVSRLFFYEAYDDNANISTQYSSSGLLNGDMSRRPAADYLYQTNKLFGTFIYQKTINSDPIVDNYQTSDGKNMYMLVVPDQKGRTATYSLDLNGADSAYVYNPKAGANDMTVNKVKLTNGKLSVSVTETPTFVTPSGLAGVVAVAPKTLLASAALPDATLNSVTLYPNPTTSNVTVAFTNTIQGPLTIKISDINSNKTYKSINYTKSGNSFSATIDITTLPKAIYVVQVLQGDQSIIRKEIKAN